MANRQNITERHVPVPRNKKPNEEDPMSTRNSRFRMAAAFALAALLSAGAAYASARFLLRYFRSGRVDPYGWYCVAAGLFSLGLLALHL